VDICNVLSADFKNWRIVSTIYVSSMMLTGCSWYLWMLTEPSDDNSNTVDRVKCDILTAEPAAYLQV